MLFKLFHKVYFMDSQVIKGTFIGMGVLLAVLIMGVLTFNYFNQKVEVVDNTETIIVVSKADESEELGYVSADLTELTTTVEDEEFLKYFNENKKTLFEESYEYKTDVQYEDGTIIETFIVTDNSYADFLNGMIVKLQEELKDKYSLKLSEIVLNQEKE